MSIIEKIFLQISISNKIFLQYEEIQNGLHKKRDPHK